MVTEIACRKLARGIHDSIARVSECPAVSGQCPPSTPRSQCPSVRPPFLRRTLRTLRCCRWVAMSVRNNHNPDDALAELPKIPRAPGMPRRRRDYDGVVQAQRTARRSSSNRRRKLDTETRCSAARFSSSVFVAVGNHVVTVLPGSLTLGLPRRFGVGASDMREHDSTPDAASMQNVHTPKFNRLTWVGRCGNVEVRADQKPVRRIFFQFASNAKTLLSKRV